MRFSLLTRIVLIVAVALFAIQILALAIFFGFGGGRGTLGESSPTLPSRVAALAELIDRVPVQLRPAALEAFNDNGRAAI